MRPLFGARTVVEAAFLVAVPVVALEVGLSWPEIIGAGAIAYLLVLGVEAAIWREGKPAPAAADAAPAPPPTVADDEHVRVVRAQPVQVTMTPREPERIVVAEAEPEPEPPRLVPVPPPPPEPEPERDPERPAAMATVVPIATAAGPREWNLWDLERVAREHAGDDSEADEERTFLLLYLRDFAGPDGLLPVDFDDLVRQSFGGLVASL